jgi:hypothetical protein
LPVRRQHTGRVLARQRRLQMPKVQERIGCHGSGMILCAGRGRQYR